MRRRAVSLLALALAGSAWALGAGCHNEYVGYEKYTASDDSVDFLLLQGDLYYLLAHTLEKFWWPRWSEGAGHKLLDRVDYLVVARNAVGSSAIEIASRKLPDPRRGYPQKDFLLLPGKPGDAEPVVIRPRSEFEDALCEDPKDLRHYAFSLERSHWLAVCGQKLVMFDSGSRRPVIGALERVIPSLSFSKFGTGRQKLFLSEGGNRVVVANTYDPTDGPAEFVDLRLGAEAVADRLLLPLPGRAQIMDVAVTEGELLAMVEFWPELDDPDDPDGSIRQAILSSNGGLYPIRLRVDGIDEDKVSRYTWDPEHSTIVVHRLVQREEGRSVLIYSYDYVRGVARVAWLPLSEILDDRIGEE